MPAAAHSASGSARSALRLWRSILRRWPNAAAVTVPSVFTEHSGDGRSMGSNSTTAEATLGAGVNAAGLTRECQPRARAPLGDDGEPAIGLAAGRRDDALGHLLLEHEDHAVPPGRPGLGLEPADQQQRGDVVGQVGRDHRLGLGAGQEVAPVGLERVAIVDRKAPGIALGDGVQRRPAALVALDRNHPLGALPGTARASARRGPARPRSPSCRRADLPCARCAASG